MVDSKNYGNTQGDRMIKYYDAPVENKNQAIVKLMNQKGCSYSMAK